MGCQERHSQRQGARNSVEGTPVVGGNQRQSDLAGCDAPGPGEPLRSPLALEKLALPPPIELELETRGTDRKTDAVTFRGVVVFRRLAGGANIDEVPREALRSEPPWTAGGGGATNEVLLFGFYSASKL